MTRNINPHDREILRLLESGYLTNKDISTKLGTAPRTVGRQLEILYMKAGVADRGELLRWWKAQNHEDHEDKPGLRALAKGA